VPLVRRESVNVKAASGDTSSRSIAAAALVITIGNLLARLFGMLREQFTSYYFGTGTAIKPFAIADSMLTILYDLLISGAIASALVPVLSNFSTVERRVELRRIVGTLLSVTLLTMSGVTIMLIIFAPQLVQLWLFSGMGNGSRIGDPLPGMALVAAAHAVGESADNAVLMPQVVTTIRLILPAIVLLGLAAVLLATNYALGRFIWPSMAQVARNGAMVIAAAALAHWLGITSMVIGVLVGAALLVVVQLPSLRDAFPYPAFDLSHPAIRRIFRLYAPISLGLLANTIGQIIDRSLAWGQAGENALGAMRYATQLQQLVLGLVATGIALGALPLLAREAEHADETGFRATLITALRMTTVLIAPAIFGLFALSSPLVRLLFGHGATTASGTHSIIIALLGYLPGTFFAAYDQLLINMFYARSNTLTPQFVGVVGVALYIGIELALVKHLGMVALVGAVSAQWAFHALTMFWLSRTIIGRAGLYAVGRVLGICLGVSIAMAVLIFSISAALGAILPGPQILRDITTLLLAGGSGVSFYIWGTALLGVPDGVILVQKGRSKLHQAYFTNLRRWLP